MKKILFLILMFLFIQCSESYIVMDKKDFVVVDTLHIAKNGFGYILSFDVLVMFKHDSTIHFGEMNKSGNLNSVNPLPIKLK